MHPVLIQFGKVTVYTYGFSIAVGFIVGILLAKHEAKRTGIDADLIMDLSFYIILSAIIGSRLFYVLTSPESFLKDPLSIIKILTGGLVFYGGFALSFIVAVIYIKIRKMPLWQTADIFAPSIALGQFFGRLGCFSAGCCFGKVCDLPWAITFNNPDSLAPTGIPLHPAQLYHAFGDLLIFSLLLFLKNKKKYEGQIFWMYIVMHGTTRFFIEIFRGDFRGKIFFNMFSISQIIGTIMVITGIVIMFFLNKKATDSKTKNA